MNKITNYKLWNRTTNQRLWIKTLKRIDRKLLKSIDTKKLNFENNVLYNIKNCKITFESGVYTYSSNVFYTEDYNMIFADYLVNTKLFLKEIKNNGRLKLEIYVPLHINFETNQFVLLMNEKFVNYFSNVEFTIDKRSLLMY